MAVERRSSLVGQGLEHLSIPCPAKAQATRHVVLQLDGGMLDSESREPLGRPMGPATPSFKLFSLQCPKKQQWAQHAHTNLHNILGFRHLITRVQHAAGGGRQVSGRSGQVSSKCRRRAAHRPSEDRKPGGVVAKGWAAFWRASDGKWRFPKAQPVLAGQTRSHVSVVLVALLHLFFFQEGTRCLLVAQCRYLFCHVLAISWSGRKLCEAVKIHLRFLRSSAASLALNSIKWQPEPSHQDRHDERVTQLLATVTNPTNAVDGTTRGDLRPS